MNTSDKELVLPAADMEEVSLEKDEGPPKITLSMVIAYLKKSVVEPYLILFMFAYSGRSITNQSLFKDKACLIELGYNHTICDDLHSYSDIENEVQIKANNYLTGYSLIGILPGMITNIFLSSWSDNYGRKIPVLIASFGIIVEYVGLIINLLDFELPIAYMILPSIPGGLLGGIVVTMTACISYVTDDSDSNTRVLRFALFEVAFILASPLGTAICGVIYEKSGYLAVYLVCLSCNVTGFLLLVFRLKEKRKKKLSHIKEAISSLFSLENVKMNIKTCTKYRGGTIRKEMWLIFVAMSCSILNLMGTVSIELFFVNKMYNWSNYKFSMVTMTFSFLKGLVVMIAVPLLTKKLTVSDITLSSIGVLSTLAQTVQKAVAYQPWTYFLASFTGLLSGLSNIGVRTRLSKLVPKEEVGRVFSVLTLCESLTPVIGITAFAQIYNLSVAFFPGLAFLVSAIFLVIAIGIFIWIAFRADNPPFEKQEESFDNDKVLGLKTEVETPNI